MALVGFLGVLLTQVITARRERQRERREQALLAAERRVATYVDFFRLTEQMRQRVDRRRVSADDIDPLSEELSDVMTRINLIAPQHVGSAVQAVNDAVVEYSEAVALKNEAAQREARERLSTAKIELIWEMRNDLRPAGMSLRPCRSLRRVGRVKGERSSSRSDAVGALDAGGSA